MYQYIMIKGDGPVNLRECYAAAAADYDDVMRRFMSENRVDRFLTMFLRDGSFELLCSAMDAGDYQDAFRAVHTIKGISMNLSLNALRDACIELTENLRAGTPDDRTQPCFDRTRAAIRSHLN